MTVRINTDAMCAKVRILNGYTTFGDSPPSNFSICPKRLLWELSPAQDTLQDDKCLCVCLVCFILEQLPCLSLPFKTSAVLKSREHVLCRAPLVQDLQISPLVAHVVVVGMS